MKIDVITAFGDMVDQTLNQSIVGRARQAGIIKLGTLSPREFTADKHKTIDDRPYGGGPGMLMKAEPLYQAINKLRKKSSFVILTSPRGQVFNQELAKKLASKYKTRIELRQIGVRDKAKKIGGLGPCGLFLCCNTFLNDFSSVSINMAKNQMLALNPSKINGMCGRLLCCLGYENETYTALKKDLPKVGLVTDTPLGMGKVVSIDVFRKKYSVDLKEKGIVTFEKED